MLEHVQASQAVLGVHLLVRAGAGAGEAPPAVQVAFGVMWHCGPSWAHPLALLRGPFHPGAGIVTRPDNSADAHATVCDGAAYRGAIASASWGLVRGKPLWDSPLEPRLLALQYHSWHLIWSSPVPGAPPNEFCLAHCCGWGRPWRLRRLVAAIPFGVGHRHRYLALLDEYACADSFWIT